MQTGCGPNDWIPDIETEDKVNILLQGSYLGHPNARRATADNDLRQCSWRDPNGPSDADFTAPLTITGSSAGALVEYCANTFGGQMRGNLLFSKYGQGIKRVILTSDGMGVIPQTDPPIDLVGDQGLGLTMAPDGSLIEVRYPLNEVWLHRPDEPARGDLWVNAVFPRRGGQAGGGTLTVYGANLTKNGPSPTVTVGGFSCPVTLATSNKIQCTLPGGSGTVDVVVSSGADSYTFLDGYRFITGTR